MKAGTAIKWILLLIVLMETNMAIGQVIQPKSNIRQCPDTALEADVVAIDHPMVFNRLGAQNVNWMMYALRHDVIDLKTQNTLDYTKTGNVLFEKAKKNRTSRGIALRPDLRPRPLVLRVAAGGYLKVNFTNLLHNKLESYPDSPQNFANPFDSFPDPLPNIDHPMEHARKDAPGTTDNKKIYRSDDQVASRVVGFHPQGLELVRSIEDDSSYAGENKRSSMAAPGETKTYCFYAPKEGAYLVSSDGAVFGGEGTSGNSGVGLFAAVTVQPKGARFYRSQVTEEEMRLVTQGKTDSDQPIVINYEKLYPSNCNDKKDIVWCQEGKAGKPVLSMTQEIKDGRGRLTKRSRIIHGDINALIIGPNRDGSFPEDTYPLESKGYRNPSVPNRLESFREFVSVFHDENAVTQAFPYFFEHPELKHTLHGVRDTFMINYGSGGVGAEVIANRLKAGPMQDCLDCALEEFFLSSFAVGDAAMLVDKPANLVISQCQPEFLPRWIKDPEDPQGKREIIDPNYDDTDFKKFCTPQEQERATEAYYPHDPANVNHSYIGDFVKIRNLHSGKEQHIFHLHNHQWLFNPNDDNSNYIDAQGIGPGSGYTYEIAFGGSGNRNKTVGDAIYHCHFYPHFAQGMWYMWRNHDVFEAGTRLAVSGEGKNGFHKRPFDLKSGKPAEEARALPDGEIIAGTPIPAIVPLPGKGIAPKPEKVHVTKKENGKGSKAVLSTPFNQETKNPGYPFWVAGVTAHGEHQSSVGSRPTTPPLDMGNIPNVVSGWDGGLPRHALAGYSDGGEDKFKLDRFTAEKLIKKAKPIYYPEKGTGLEQVAMDFHATREHPTYKIDMQGNIFPAYFVTNGSKPVPGAPFNDPCIDDQGEPLKTGGNGYFFGGNKESYIDVKSSLPGGVEFGGDRPRVYKGANIQLDVVFNKLGYHYPQQRILALWEDVGALLSKERPPEPLVMRLNTFDCAMYAHTNLVPSYFAGDDYQITTPTDVIGQHIHLPKWDLTSADGGANGWNYEDGTFSPLTVLERIHAINAWNKHAKEPVRTLDGKVMLTPSEHPYFSGNEYFSKLELQIKGCTNIWDNLLGDGINLSIDDHNKRFLTFIEEYSKPGKCDWLGARTTLQRWFSDPVVNIGGIHRGLGITFTHDHLGASTHQQLGLYATMLSEPPGSEWRHNETGEKLYTRADGGPTSWQAVITGKDGKCIDIDRDSDGDCTKKGDDSHREFFLQFGDFQHAYVKDEYIGVNAEGVSWIFDRDNAIGSKKYAKPTKESFRKSINPSVRKPAEPVFPDILAFDPTCPGGKHEPKLPGAVYNKEDRPPRPCPEAISADDVGMMVVNYRNEPIGARVYDPKTKKQADGERGDLAFAMQTRKDRAIPELNTIRGDTPYVPLTFRNFKGDPFTPILRAYSGDKIRVKVQGGAHEHEHNGSINAMAWIQGGSGFGQAPHSGWRNSQNTGLSEQFTFTASITDYQTPLGIHDRMYTVDTSQDGLWNGVWGIIRSRSHLHKSDKLAVLPSNPLPTVLGPNNDPDPELNTDSYRGGCPSEAPPQKYKVSAVLANEVLSKPKGIVIPKAPEDAYLDVNGGTLVYNPRDTAIKIQYRDKVTGEIRTQDYHVTGPLHDPTAIMFVLDDDLVLENGSWKIKPGMPVEPLVLRAAAGECIEIELTNRLPADSGRMPDLDGYTSLSGIIIRDEGTFGSKMTTFNNNLIRPSNHIGLHPQLVHYDVHESDGNSIGLNANSLVSPEGEPGKYFWYAGVVDTKTDNTCVLDRESEHHNKMLDRLNKISLLSLNNQLSKVIDSARKFKRDVKDNFLDSIDNDFIEERIGKKIDKDIFHFEEKLFGKFINYLRNVKEDNRDYFHDELSEIYWNWRSGEFKGSKEPNNLSGASIGKWFYQHNNFRTVKLAKKGDLNDHCSRYVPVEFGGTNLTPPDRIKQGQKGAIGALVIEPEKSKWDEKDQVIDRQNPGSDQSNKRATRTMADVTYPVIEENGKKQERIFRDLVMVHQKGLNLRYKDGSAVPNIAAEKENPDEAVELTVPEDAHDSGHMAINYGAEPMWFRFGLPPDAVFGKSGLGGVDSAWEVFSNRCCNGNGGVGTVAGATPNVGEPYVPIMTAYAGQEMRIHALMPTGTGRASTMELHGHGWPRDPYLAEHVVQTSRGAFPAGSSEASWGIPSKCIGENAMAMQMGGQESLSPMAHFDMVFPHAGGKRGVKGDFLWRDHGGFGITNGLWALIRVKEAPTEYGSRFAPRMLRTNCDIPG